MNFTFLNKLSDIPSSGVYMPAEKIAELLKDYNGNLIVKKDINDFFGKSATSAFIESLIYAQKNNLGLLEANAILKLELAVGDETEIVNTIQEAENDVENKVLFQNEGEEKKSVFSRIFRKK